MDAAARCIWPVLVLLGAGTAGADHHFHDHHPWHGPCEPVPECRVPPLHQRPILRALPVHPDCGPGPQDHRSLRSSLPEILGLLAGLAHGELGLAGPDRRGEWHPAPPDFEREREAARREQAAAESQAERERQAAAAAQSERER
ncbi:MAG: hypothetical protein HKN82_14460, partial [Akkermansiaceae bacterium]|nr:hypothetical protein [Akkermansiaceae bacterium]